MIPIQRYARTLLTGLCAALMFVASGTAFADPPTRVARLSYIHGAISFAPAGEDEWVVARANRPLITGDRIWADAGARTELQIGSAALRLGASTSATILNLDDRVAQLQVTQGTVNVHVRRLAPDEVIEIDTPNLALSIKRPPSAGHRPAGLRTGRTSTARSAACAPRRRFPRCACASRHARSAAGTSDSVHSAADTAATPMPARSSAP